MSASLSNIQPDEYLYFSSKTGVGCAGKPVKIHKKLAVAFIAAVDPKSHEGQSVIAGIEQLTALAQDTQAHTHVNNAAVKMKAVGSITVCYVVTQAAGDRTPTVYITNFRQRFKNIDILPSGLFRVQNVSTWGPPKATKSMTLTTTKLFISGLADSLEEAAVNGLARLGIKDFDLFYTDGDEMEKLGAWSLPASTNTSGTLAKILNSYSGKDRIQVYVEGYGAHVLNSALLSVSDLSRFSFALENTVTDIASLIQAIDTKNGKYSSQDAVAIYPGKTSLREFDASKIALAYSRLALIKKVNSSDKGKHYAQVLLELYPSIKGMPANKLEDGLKAQDKRTGRDISVNYSASFSVNNFVELINRAMVK